MSDLSSAASSTLVAGGGGWTAPGFVRPGPPAVIRDASALAPNAGGWGDDDDVGAETPGAPLGWGQQQQQQAPTIMVCYPILSIPRACDYAFARRPTTPTRRFDVAAGFVRRRGDGASSSPSPRPRTPEGPVAAASAPPTRPAAPMGQPNVSLPPAAPHDIKAAPAVRVADVAVAPASRQPTPPLLASDAPTETHVVALATAAVSGSPARTTESAAPNQVTAPPETITAFALGAECSRCCSDYIPKALEALFGSLGISNPPTSWQIFDAVNSNKVRDFATGAVGFGAGKVQAAVAEIEAALLALLPAAEVERCGLKPLIARYAHEQVLKYTVGYMRWRVKIESKQE